MSPLMTETGRDWLGIRAASTLLFALGACTGAGHAARPASSNAAPPTTTGGTPEQAAGSATPVEAPASAAPGCSVMAGGICFASVENACQSLNCAPNPCLQSTQGEVRCA